MTDPLHFLSTLITDGVSRVIKSDSYHLHWFSVCEHNTGRVIVLPSGGYLRLSVHDRWTTTFASIPITA